MILVDQLFPTFTLTLSMLMYLVLWKGTNPIFLHPVEHFQVKDIAEHFSIGIGF